MNWTEVRPLGNTNQMYRGVMISKDVSCLGALIEWVNPGLYLSSDGGANWTLSTGFIYQQNYTCSMSDDGQTMFVGGQYNVYTAVSTDGGANWTQIDADTSMWGGYDIVASDMTPDGSVIVISVSGIIWRSDDTGATWRSLGFRDTSHPGDFGDSVSISKSGTRILYVYNGSLWLSKDGGMTWEEQLTSLSSPHWSTAAMSKDGSTMLAAGQLQSGDGGRLYLNRLDEGWNEVQPLDAGQHDWSCVSATEEGNCLFAGMVLDTVSPESDTLFSSIDYGKTWSAERPRSTVQSWGYTANRATARAIVAGVGSVGSSNRLYITEALPTVPDIFPWLGKFQLVRVVEA
jgi:hypothetical protein